MLPIVDYGGIAVVIPKISAVSGIKRQGTSFGFRVHLGGGEEPVMVLFDTRALAVENREELLSIIARYYYLKDFGPDFDPENVENMFADSGDMEDMDDLDDDEDDRREKH